MWKTQEMVAPTSHGQRPAAHAAWPWCFLIAAGGRLRQLPWSASQAFTLTLPSLTTLDPPTWGAVPSLFSHSPPAPDKLHLAHFVKWLTIFPFKLPQVSTALCPVLHCT